MHLETAMFFTHLLIAIKITLTGFLIYRIGRFLRMHRTWELCVLFCILSLLAAAAINGNGAATLHPWLLTAFLTLGMLIAFEPELADFGNQLVESLNPHALKKNRIALAEIARAAGALSATKTGALIAFERNDSLLKFGDTGIEINADIKKELLMTLFTKDTPTHDGGILIRKGRMTHCGAVFPLSERKHIENGLGTRHRAALGLTEKTDAVCLVVSEEEGTISLTKGGELIYGVSPKGLEKKMAMLLTSRDRNFYYPLHYLGRFSVKLAEPNLIHFSKSKGRRIFDISAATFWLFTILIGISAHLFRLSDIARPVATLLVSPWILAPWILFVFSVMSLLSGHTLTVSGRGNQVKFERRFLLLPMFQRRLSASDLNQVVLRRERTGRNLQSLWLVNKKRKAFFVDRSTSVKALTQAAKKIREVLRIDLIG